MKKIVVTFTRIPTNYHDPQSLVVEAETPDDAIKIVQDHLRDHGSMRNYSYYTSDYVPPPAGKILGAPGTV